MAAYSIQTLFSFQRCFFFIKKLWKFKEDYIRVLSSIFMHAILGTLVNIYAYIT